MSLESHFQVPKEVRQAFIDEHIIGILPEDVEGRDILKNRTLETINMYVGQDANALSLLAYAAEKGRLTEFVSRLEGIYNQSTPYLHPQIRSFAEAHNIRKVDQFFVGCYQELGIEPQSTCITKEGQTANSNIDPGNC